MKTLFPYATLFGDVTLTVTGVEIDDTPLHGRTDADARAVRLESVEREEWSTARLQVELAGPASELADRVDPVAVLVANCGASNSRCSVVLTPEDSTPARWNGALTLERSHWYGRATLTGSITATVDGVPDRIIGTTKPWLIEFDDLPSRPVAGGITIRWVEFADPPEDARYLRTFSTDPFYLRIDPDEPILFLNRSFEGLEALLVDRRRRAADRALHDQTRASIATKVWLSLFNASLDGAIVDDDGSVSWPEADWQRTVLESLLVRMYQDRNAEEALVDAVSARRAPDAAATLQEMLLPAASTQARLPRLLRDGIRILSHEFTADEHEEQP